MRASETARSSAHVTAFFLLSQLAEGGQSVILLWLTYALTGNAVLVGVVVLLSYLPATIVGLFFRRFADRGRADHIAQRTNIVLSVVSLLLAAELWAAGSSAVPTIAAIMASQIVLSLVKMVNKAAIGRLVRDSFDEATSRRVLQISSSASLIGIVVGAGIAGVLISRGWTVPSVLLAAAAYVASAVTMTRGTRGYRPSDPPPARSGDDVGHAVRSARWDARMVTVLLFSVPSSGALQFVATLLVPLSQAISPGHPGYYAILDVSSIVGGFLAGALLSANVLSSRLVLNLGLPVAAALALALGATEDQRLVPVMSFALSFAITAHVVCMQVLTNQVPEPHEVGQFTVMRNIVASLSKAVFSFAAGALVGLTSSRTAAVVLAVSFVPFAIAWPAMLARSRGVSAAVS